MKFASDGDRTLHLVYTDGHPIEYLQNSVYHLYLRDGVLHRSDGTAVTPLRRGESPAIDPTSGTRLYDGTVLPGGQAWTWDVALDAAGAPVAVFSTFPDPARPYYDHRYRYARWDGAAWHVSTIAYGGTGLYTQEGFYSGGIAIDPDDPDIVYVSSNVDPITGEPTASAVFEIFRGVTADLGETWTITPVTQGSVAQNIRPIVPAGHADPTTVLWLQGTYETYLSYETRVVGLFGAADVQASWIAPGDPLGEALARFDLASTADGPASPTAPGFVAAVPAAGVASAETNGIRLDVTNITGSRDAGTGDLLHRDLVFCDRGGLSPDDKLTVTLSGLTPGQDYVVRLHGNDAGAYLQPTLWFRGDSRSLAIGDDSTLLGAHRNGNGVYAGEGASDFVLTADDRGEIVVIGRGLDDLNSNDRVAVLNGVEVFARPTTAPVAAFDVDLAVEPATDSVSLTFDPHVEWTGSARSGDITVSLWTDRVEALRERDVADDVLSELAFGRDHLAVDVDGLEPGRTYEVTVHSADFEHNQHAATRWRLDEPGAQPVVVRSYHLNEPVDGPSASFTFYHRATAGSFRLRAHDIMTSLSTEPSVVVFNAISIRVVP